MLASFISVSQGFVASEGDRVPWTRLPRGGSWSGASLAAYGRRPIFAWQGSYLFQMFGRLFVSQPGIGI